jgi:hypothetical protein
MLVLSFATTSLYAKQSISVLDIEYVEGKTQEMVVEVKLPKSYHGKKRTKKEIHKINTKPMKGNKSANIYISNLKSKIESSYTKYLKISPVKSSGVVKVKIQVQGDGRYDVLFIDGVKPDLISYTEKVFTSIKKFNSLPLDAGQGELQLIIPVSYKRK